MERGVGMNTGSTMGEFEQLNKLHTPHHIYKKRRRCIEMIDEILMLVDFDSIKTLDSVMQLRTLKDIKNDMIGTAEAKQSYFDKGLIETVMPLLPTKDLDRNVRFEIFTVLNSFLFDCPRAVETLRLFEE